MFPNSITLTVAGTGFPLLRINQDNYGSEYLYKDAGQKLSMKIRHSLESQKGSSDVVARHNVFVEHNVYATPTSNAVTRTCTYTLRAPELSDPQAAADLSDGLAGFVGLAANSLLLAQGVN